MQTVGPRNEIYQLRAPVRYYHKLVLMLTFFCIDSPKLGLEHTSHYLLECMPILFKPKDIRTYLS